MMPRWRFLMQLKMLLKYKRFNAIATATLQIWFGTSTQPTQWPGFGCFAGSGYCSSKKEQQCEIHCWNCYDYGWFYCPILKLYPTTAATLQQQQHCRPFVEGAVKKGMLWVERIGFTRWSTDWLSDSPCQCQHRVAVYCIFQVAAGQQLEATCDGPFALVVICIRRRTVSYYWKALSGLSRTRVTRELLQSNKEWAIKFTIMTRT